MRNLGILILFLLAVFVAQAANVSMTGDDGFGTSSFNSAGKWDNAAAPSAGNDYFIGSHRLRTPPDGASYTFAGDSLQVDADGLPDGDSNKNIMGLSFKGTGSAVDITINNLIVNGGSVNHLNAPSTVFSLYGSINVVTDSLIYAKQGPINVYSDISGSATISNPGSDNTPCVLTFYSPDSTFTGNIVNDGRFTLAAGEAGEPNAILNFVIGATGVNNSVSGDGAATVFNGQFNIDLTGAGAIPGNSWAIVTASNASYGETFALNGFTDAGGGTWLKDANGTTYQFDESTGILSVYIPELHEDPIDYILFDTEYTVLNGGFALPGTGNTTGGSGDGTAWDNVPGWIPTAGTVADSGVAEDATAPDGDGWYGSFKRGLNTDPNIYNISDANFIEDTTYTFTAYAKPRFGVKSAILRVVADDDPNIALTSSIYELPATTSDLWYGPYTVSYTATASDVGKKIGIYLDGMSDDDESWIRYDDVHLYTDYLAIHGVIDQAPDGGDVTPAAPLALSWTPTNDPNFNGVDGDDQVLYYYIANGDGSAPDYTSYIAASGISKGIAGTSHSIAGGIDYDQYCLWRVDTVIDGITYTGKTILFTTLTADEVPDIQEWDWYRTWVGEPASIWADVNDFGEGDIDLGGIDWTVTVGDPNLVLTDISTDPLYPEATVVADAIGDYEVQLVVTDTDGSLGSQSSDPAVYQIHVYADACAAAIANGAVYNIYDSDQDCDVDMVDFAAFAAQWLDDIKLTEAAAY